ncbi:hypothetical protein JKF63_00215 [Porcisia hertigi]|uniref:Uncharacterized protein n=1 Tax=Porcisia hertigi TaxID=2761500 RepID=A0A836HB87_9TRYP|nr:hypothetical protein JKF63_00215 [Porcisia hertigi]
MEALFYDHTVTSAIARRAHLRQAIHAFLADATSRSAVHVVALFVHVPTPSTVAVAVPSLGSSRTTDSASASREGTSVAARGATAGKAAAVTSTSLPVVSRRSRTAQKLAWCSWEADRRLRQAAEDAAEIHLGIGDGCLSGPLTAGAARAGSPVTRAMVVTVAFLAPKTRDDLTVYESWQRCADMCAEVPAAGAGRGAASRATRMFSPLRHASFIALSLGAPSLLLSWTERPVRCHLDNLLLPHQSLLMDLSWWMASTGEGASATNGAPSGKGVSNSVLRDIFIRDVQPSLKLPKGDCRCAVWLSYDTLLASLHPHAVGGRGNNISGDGVNMSGRAGEGLSGRRWGCNARSGDLSGVDEQAFMATYVLIRRLLSSLNASQSGSLGRTQLLRVVLSYGGSSSSLRRRLVHTCGRIGQGDLAVDAALLCTRSLVDVHALFAVLAGQDAVNVYSEAAMFVRTARRRATAGQASQQQHRQIALQSAQVQVTLPCSSDPTGTEHEVVACGNPSALSNSFAERGARTLARKLRLLERQRVCKKGRRGEHVRPRAKTSMGPTKRLRAEVSSPDSERALMRAVERAHRAAAPPTARKKHKAELLASGTDEPSACATQVSSPPQEQQRTDEVLGRLTPTMDTALTWCEDVDAGVQSN